MYRNTNRLAKDLAIIGKELMCLNKYNGSKVDFITYCNMIPKFKEIVKYHKEGLDNKYTRDDSLNII